jgi:hypothetical protein
MLPGVSSPLPKKTRTIIESANLFKTSVLTK